MTKFVGFKNGVLTEIRSDFPFEQNQPALVWNITHPLGKFPSVTVVDSGGTEVEGVVSYPSSSQVRVEFSHAFSGMAYLN